MKKHKNSFLWRGEVFSKKDLDKLKNDKVWIWWVAMVVLTALIFIVPALGSVKTFDAGEICENTIYYEGNTLSYMSDVKYRQAQEAVKEQVNPIYVLNNQNIIDSKGRIATFVGEIIKIKNSEASERNALYQSLLGENFSEDVVAIWENIDVDKLYQLETDINEILNVSFAPGVKEADFQVFMSKLSEQIAEEGYNTVENSIMDYLLGAAKLEPNNIYDKEATLAIIDAKQKEMKPAQVTVRPGQILVQRGTTITEEQVEMLDKTGLLTTNKSMLYYPGIIIFTLMIYFLIYIYCRRYFPEYAYGKQGIRLLCSFLVMFLLICEAIMFLATSMTGVLYSVLGYLLPLPAMAVIFSTLTNQRFSYFLVSIVSLLVAILTLSQPAYFIVALMSSLFTVHIVGRIRERYHLISFGFYIGLINVSLIIAVGFIGGQGNNALIAGAVVGMVSGFLSSLLALGVLPLAETFFKMTTPMKLLELANPGHPLIKRLMTEAPGTYYHSVLVGNLAEVAADSVGADSNLVRVASYFHDVGKLERPKYFVENQEPNMNPHEKLNPSLSTLIIVSHVKDGVEMAEDYDLPQSVVNIINEHHGDSVVQYFYHKAKAKAGAHSEPVHKDDFRYPHPKPQSKESAVLMMADSVQAALQSCSVKSKGDIRAKIHDIIQGQLAAGQFEECDLTFRDLHKVQEAFFSVLSGLSHYRIEYPSMTELDTKELVKELAAKKKVAVAEVEALVEETPAPRWIVPEEGISVEMDAPKLTEAELSATVLGTLFDEEIKISQNLKEFSKNED